jgi:hypothetical protein
LCRVADVMADLQKRVDKLGRRDNANLLRSHLTATGTSQRCCATRSIASYRPKEPGKRPKSFGKIAS